MVGYPPNVEVNRSKEGAAPAPQEACLTQESVPTIGSAVYALGEQQVRHLPSEPCRYKTQRHAKHHQLLTR